MHVIGIYKKWEYICIEDTDYIALCNTGQKFDIVAGQWFCYCEVIRYIIKTNHISLVGNDYDS